MSVCPNIVDVLARRNVSTSFQYRECIESIIEKRFIDRHKHFDYDLVHDMVLSTIAIALSSNGALVASTHGDHTVKIFQQDTGKLIHVCFVFFLKFPTLISFDSMCAVVLLC